MVLFCNIFSVHLYLEMCMTFWIPHLKRKCLCNFTNISGNGWTFIKSRENFHLEWGKPIKFKFKTKFQNPCLYNQPILVSKLPNSSKFIYWNWISTICVTKGNRFSSVAQLCLTFCNPLYCSTQGFSVHHQLTEFTQTRVHQVSDAIHPSHPVSSPSPPAFSLSQHQGLFQWVGVSHQVA